MVVAIKVIWKIINILSSVAWGGRAVFFMRTLFDISHLLELEEYFIKPSVGFCQLKMTAFLGNLAFFENHYLVRFFDRAQTMGDYDDRASAADSIHRVLNQLF